MLPPASPVMETSARFFCKEDELCNQLAGILRCELSYLIPDASPTTERIPKIPFTTKNDAPSIHTQWRPVIFEWFYKIIDHFLLERGIVAIAMDYLDRFLLIHPSGNSGISQKMYQLIAMTSLYIAMKLHGGNDRGDETARWKIKRRTFCLKGFVKLSRGQFVPEDVLSMETLILKTLAWKMNPVTVSCFLDSLLMLIPRPHELFENLDSRTLKRLKLAQHVLHNLARYLVELAICIPGISPYFVTEHSGKYVNQLAPSSVSYAAMLLALDMMTVSAIPLRARHIFLDRCANAQNRVVHDKVVDYEYMRFNPDRMEIQQLKNLILEYFSPSLLLCPIPANDPELQFHPFKVAKAAGMLNMKFFQESKSEGQPQSPTSPLDGNLL